MYCIMPLLLQKNCQVRRLQFADTRGCLLSASPDTRLEFRLSVRPIANNRRTVAAGIRIPRTQGTPPICAVSALITSYSAKISSCGNFTIHLSSQPAQERSMADSRAQLTLRGKRALILGRPQREQLVRVDFVCLGIQLPTLRSPIQSR